MTLILAILFFVFVLYPVGKMLWRGYRMQQNWKRATDGFRQAYRQATNGTGNNAAPKRKKKKIDPNVGEYVNFEEVSDTTSQTQQTQAGTSYSSTTYTESQIEDAVWEEIPE